MGWRRVIVSLCTLVMAAVTVPVMSDVARAAQGLVGVDLGTLGGSYSNAAAINEYGQAVGVSKRVVGPNHAFSWTVAGGMIDLGDLGGGYSTARDVNDAGVVVGESTTAAGGVRAFRWTAAGGMTALPTLGGDALYAVVLNNAGSVAGSSLTSAGNEHGFFWSPAGGIVDLGTLGGTSSHVVAMNDADVVTGWSYTATGAFHGFVWDAASGMTDIGSLGGESTYVGGINSSGVVTGTSDAIGGVGFAQHGFTWDATSGMTDIGQMTQAVGINDAGEVAGGGHILPSGASDAVRWSPSDGLITLDVPSSGGSSLTTGINDGGLVIGGTPNSFVTDPYGGQHRLVGPYGLNGASDVNDAGQVVGYSADNPEPWFGGTGHATLWQATTARTVSVAGAAVVESAGTQKVNATLTLSTPSPTPVVVRYSIYQGTWGAPGSYAFGDSVYSPGVDFKERSGTLKFLVQPNGLTKTSKLITATTFGDTTDEVDEHFLIVLTSATGASLGTSKVPMTIFDDDPGSGNEVGVGDASIWEGDSGGPNLVKIAITLRQPLFVRSSVLVTTGGTSATPGVDYTGVSKRVSFAAGAVTGSVTLKINADATDEGSGETITVVLSDPQGGLTLGRSTGTVTIQDDD